MRGIIAWITGSATVSSVNSSTPTLPRTAATASANGRLACAATTVETACFARNGSTLCHAASISLDVGVLEIVVVHDLEQRLDGRVQRRVHRIPLHPSVAMITNDVTEIVEERRRVEVTVAVHPREALHALEPELGRLEAGLGEQGRGHGPLAGHAAVQRALPRAFLVTLERAAGERGGEPERVVRVLRRTVRARVHTPAAAPNVP